MPDPPAALTHAHSYSRLCLLCSPPLGSCWGLQFTCPGIFLLNSNNIVLQLLFETTLRFFYYETKNSKRGTPISLVPYGTPNRTPGLYPPTPHGVGFFSPYYHSEWTLVLFDFWKEMNQGYEGVWLPPLQEQNTNAQMFRFVSTHMNCFDMHIIFNKIQYQSHHLTLCFII